MLGTRILTGIVFGGAVTASILFLPSEIALGVLAILWLAGAWEWAGFARLSPMARYGYVGAFAALMLAAATMRPPLPLLDALLAIALAGWCFALVGVLRFPWRIPLPSVAIAGPVALLPSWVLLKVIHETEPQGPKLALLALALVWAADIGAYASGRLFGRVKLAPDVSPGKTWEGVCGGILLALLVAYFGALWLRFPTWPLVAVGLGTALASVVGDLTESMLKRNVGLKDASHILPGHGGVMDRIDGLVAAVPMYAAGLRVAGLLG